MRNYRTLAMEISKLRCKGFLAYKTGMTSWKSCKVNKQVLMSLMNINELLFIAPSSCCSILVIACFNDSVCSF